MQLVFEVLFYSQYLDIRSQGRLLQCVQSTTAHQSVAIVISRLNHPDAAVHTGVIRGLTRLKRSVLSYLLLPCSGVVRAVARACPLNAKTCVAALQLMERALRDEILPARGIFEVIDVVLESRYYRARVPMLGAALSRVLAVVPARLRYSDDMMTRILGAARRFPHHGLAPIFAGMPRDTWERYGLPAAVGGCDARWLVACIPEHQARRGGFQELSLWTEARIDAWRHVRVRGPLAPDIVCGLIGVIEGGNDDSLRVKAIRVCENFFPRVGLPEVCSLQVVLRGLLDSPASGVDVLLNTIKSLGSVYLHVQSPEIPSAREVLVPLFSHTNTTVAAFAMEVVASCPVSALRESRITATDFLRELSKHDDIKVRSRMLNSIAGLPAAASAGVVEAFGVMPPPGSCCERAAIYKILSRHDRARGLLVEAMSRDPDEKTRCHVAYCLATMVHAGVGDPRWIVSFFLRHVHECSGAVRVAICEQLVRLPARLADDMMVLERLPAPSLVDVLWEVSLPPSRLMAVATLVIHFPFATYGRHIVGILRYAYLKDPYDEDPIVGVIVSRVMDELTRGATPWEKQRIWKLARGLPQPLRSRFLTPRVAAEFLTMLEYDSPDIVREAGLFFGEYWSDERNILNKVDVRR